MAVDVGSKAPDFTLPASNGKRVSLSDFRGKHVVLYFYPKDDTPGCTREACDFRDWLSRFTMKEAVVLGVSPDSVSSHEQFIEKFNLPFLLLADEDKSVARTYGVWVTKNLYGKTQEGIERTTFVIGPDGVVKVVFRQVKVQGHVDEVFAALEAK